MISTLIITGLLIIFISLIYLFFRNKLSDLQFMVNRFGYYSIIALPFSFVLVLSISFISQVHLDAKNIILVSVILFLGTNFLLYIKEYLDYKFRHHLFSQKGNLELSLYTFFQKAKHETKVTSLISYLLTEIENVLSVKEASYFEVYKVKGKDRWSVSDKSDNTQGFMENINEVNWAYSGIGTLMKIGHRFGVVIAGNYHRKKIIVFKVKSPKNNLNIQEKTWLETIAYFSSILLENFQHIEELFDEIEHYKWNGNYSPWLSRLLFSLSEKERTNLSIDLHDSLLQEQLQLLREVERMERKTSDDRLQKDLASLQELILDNIHLVRITCNDLQPPFLSEIGVIQSIQNLIDQTNLRCSFTITSELEQSIQWLDKEIELTLYRVVQELFNNAMKHSHATNVTLQLHKKDHVITLMYKDDGVGFDSKELQDSFKTMGLLGVQERVRSIGGHAQIDSSEGKGMSALIEIRERVN